MKQIYFLLTSVMVNMGSSLKCPDCIASKWTNQTCRVTTCPSLSHSCLSLDARLLEQTEGIHSYLLNKTCIKTEECDEYVLCKKLKTDMFKMQEDIFVSDCKANCTPGTSSPPFSPTRGTYDMTRIPSTRESPTQKCFACERNSLSTLCNERRRNVSCESSGFDSCFTLKAELINATSGLLIEEGQWQDCAVKSQDCGVGGVCAQLRRLLRLRGYDWRVCIAECCSGDYCNDFIPTPPVKHEEDAWSDAEALHSKVFLLFIGFISILSKA